MIRVYLPVDLATLGVLHSTGALPAPAPAHTVTDAVRREWADVGEEEREYEVLSLAAEDCTDERRVVVAADVDRVEPVGRDDPSLVTVPEAVRLAQVAAVHADATAAERATGGDLGWYATQEIDQLI